jgi:chromosome segregation ATPase
MAKKPEEILADLQKQKEDIEILLSSLEEAYSEAGITEKQYKEVKIKNNKKLKDLEKKIKTIGIKAETEERKAKTDARKKAKEQPVAKEPKTVGDMIAAEQGQVPVSQPIEGESMPSVSETLSVPETPEPETPSQAAQKQDEKRFSSDDIKSMLSRFIKEIKPGGLEVLPKVEKMQIKLEKMGAFLDAVKDEKTSRDETIRRLTEEIGEIRSNVNALDRKASQQEIIINEVNTSISDLKPQRFVKFLRKEDMQMKMHDSRIQRLEDMNTLAIKRLTTIEDVLKKIGSLEKIADFGRDIAKRLVEIDNREKRIGRISDKIDSIFMELNKRLDEFMLYKAKQDTLDELSREMMKAVDEINTKIEKYAEKEDLDLLRDTLERRIAGVSTGAAASPEAIKLREQKEEIEGLLDMLEEQFKKGDIKKEEYEKAKKVNTERIATIEKKIQEVSNKQTTAPLTGEEPSSWANIEPEQPAEPAEGAAKTSKPTDAAKMTDKPGSSVTPKPSEAPAAKTRAKPPKDREEKMIKDLEESYSKGEISKAVFEQVRRKLLKK